MDVAQRLDEYAGDDRSASEPTYADNRRMTIWGLSKQVARYRKAPDADVRCDRCEYMFPPLTIGGCRLVRGVIRGSATCDEFRRRARG